MNDFEEMRQQVKDKIESGFTCIKIKIGAFDFNEELKFIKKIRSEFGYDFEMRLGVPNKLD